MQHQVHGQLTLQKFFTLANFTQVEVMYSKQSKIEDNLGISGLSKNMIQGHVNGLVLP